MSLPVRDVMAIHPITVRPHETARHAYQLMRDNRFRHLPVVEDGRLVGILSDRDLRPVLLSPGLARARVRELMSEDLTTVGPETPIEEAASLLVVKKIGCLPVVAQGRLVGIVTETDLLAVPSLWYENDPLVVKAAFYCGTPVLAARIGSLGEMVEPGRNGWLVPPGDAGAWAAALERFAGAPAPSAMAPTRVKTMDENAREMLDIYTEELARR